MVAAAIIGGAVVGAVGSSVASRKASKAQSSSAQAGIDSSNYQFDRAASILKPYVEAGAGSQGTFNSQAYLAANPDVAADPYYSQHPEEHWNTYGKGEGRNDPGRIGATTGSLQAQQDLLGLNGNDAQKAAISGIENSAQFTSLVNQGETGILQNASATGGLRGGNTQAALAQFRPQLLSQLITDQYNKLGGITQIGQASAAGQASANIQQGQTTASLLQQQGAAQAGNYLAQGQAISNVANTVGSYGLLKQAKVF